MSYLNNSGECKNIGYDRYESDDDPQDRRNFRLRRKLEREQNAEDEMFFDRYFK